MILPPISRILLASVVIFLIAGSAGKNSLAQTIVATLERGSPVERELKTGEKHSYRIMLRPGESAHLRVNVWAITTTIRVFGPDDTQLLSEQQLDGLDTRRLFVIADKAGGYRLEIVAPDQSEPQGRYEINVVALAAATAEDRNRFASQQMEGQARRLLNQLTLESLREALVIYRKALGLWASLDDREGEGVTLHSIGTAYYYLGEKRKAMDYFNQALTRVRAVGNQPMESIVLNDLGVVSIEVGELQHALKYYEQSLALRRAMLHERRLVSPRMEALLVYHIGMVYRDSGEYQKALDYFRQSLPLWETWLDGQAYTLHAVGGVYARLGDAQQALDHYDRALSIWRKREADPRALGNKVTIGQRATGTLTSIGAVYASMGQWQLALEHYERALGRARAEKFLEVEAGALTHMGAAHLSRGDHQKALGCFNEALPIFQKLSDRVREADTLRGIGETYRLSGNPHKALEYLGQALIIQRAVRDQLSEAATAYGIARAERDLGRFEEARAHIEAALDLIEFLRSKITSHELRASYLASKQEYYEFYIDLLMLLDSRRPSAGYGALALQANERARARSLLDTLTEAGAEIREGLDPQLLERERDLQDRLNAKSERLTRLHSVTRAPEERVAATKELESIVADYREVQGQIRAASPRYAALTQPRPLSAKEIQTEVLDGDTLLLEYALGERRSHLWAVTRDSLTSFELPKRSDIEHAARNVYELLTARNRHPARESAEEMQSRVRQADKAYPRAAQELSRMLLAPVAKQLATKKRLLIVCEGALQYVPFGALTVSRTTGESTGQRRASQRKNPGVSITPLLVTHEIVSVPSASVLETLRRKNDKHMAPDKALAVIADPVFSPDDPRMSERAKGASGLEFKVAMTEGKTASQPTGLPSPQATRDVERSARESGVGTFVRLRFSGEEARGIANLVPSAARLVALDFAANRPTARNELSRYRVVHFATHGLINSKSPELSGLVLSLVDEQGRQVDGFLRLHEIYNLKLSADLVVLSACQTALGKEIKGEGLVGLTRGFMYAGAPRVVASLWRIDDRATAELMKHFYRGMLGPRRLSAAAALRAAQLEMWKEEGWETPYYWSAFTLQGEWN